jgi:hypothetical protein
LKVALPSDPGNLPELDKHGVKSIEIHELVQKYISGWMKIINYLRVDDNGTKKILQSPLTSVGQKTHGCSSFLLWKSTSIG